MDLTNLTTLKELGIAIVSVVAMVYLSKYLVDVLKQVVSDLTTQLKENREDYTNFVETNNHGNTERIEKSTTAMVEVAKSIEMHNRSTELHNQILERLIAKLDK